MTTSKPEVMAWMKPAPPTMNSVDSVITAEQRRGAARMTLTGYKIALVRLSDYEALQAENNRLVEALEASAHGLHQAVDGEGECRCGQCAFVRLRDAALAAHQGGES